MIGAEYIQENLVDDFEPEDGVERLSDPEKPKIPGAVAPVERKSNRKKRDLHNQKREENRKLLVKLPAPQHCSNGGLQARLRAPQVQRRRLAAEGHCVGKGQNRATTHWSRRFHLPLSSGRLVR